MKRLLFALAPLALTLSACTAPTKPQPDPSPMAGTWNLRFERTEYSSSPPFEQIATFGPGETSDYPPSAVTYRTKRISGDTSRCSVTLNMYPDTPFPHGVACSISIDTAIGRVRWESPEKLTGTYAWGSAANHFGKVEVTRISNP